MNTTRNENELDHLLEDELINARLFDSLSADYVLRREAKQNPFLILDKNHSTTDLNRQGE